MLIHAEVIINQVSGIITGWLLTFYALPLFGFETSAGQAAGITLMFFLVNYTRMYIIRLMFAKNSAKIKHMLDKIRYTNKKDKNETSTI